MLCSRERRHRYAGVSLSDVDNLTDSQAAYIQDCCSDKNVQISSLAYYLDPMDGDLEKRSFILSTLNRSSIRAILFGR